MYVEFPSSWMPPFETPLATSPVSRPRNSGSQSRNGSFPVTSHVSFASLGSGLYGIIWDYIGFIWDLYGIIWRSMEINHPQWWYQLGTTKCNQGTKKGMSMTRLYLSHLSHLFGAAEIAMFPSFRSITTKMALPWCFLVWFHDMSTIVTVYIMLYMYA